MVFMNAPEIFMQIMNNLLIDMLDKTVLVFLIKVFIYSNIVEEYFEHLKKLIRCLYKYVFDCKLKKCNFL